MNVKVACRYAACSLITYASLMGADAKLVHGLVTDAGGRPLAGVRIHHAGGQVVILTDAAGRFQVQTSAPVLILRKNSFAPLLVKTSGEELRAIMSPDRAAAAPCKHACSGNWHLCFKHVKGVKEMRPQVDADYVARRYDVQVGAESGGIVHGRGPTWTLGAPEDDQVWNSREYVERDYAVGDCCSLLDARGKTQDGLSWRFIAAGFESAFYDRASTQVAALLDRVLDSVCVVPYSPSKPPI